MLNLFYSLSNTMKSYNSLFPQPRRVSDYGDRTVSFLQCSQSSGSAKFQRTDGGFQPPLGRLGGRGANAKDKFRCMFFMVPSIGRPVRTIPNICLRKAGASRLLRPCVRRSIVPYRRLPSDLAVLPHGFHCCHAQNKNISNPINQQVNYKKYSNNNRKA
jgi:hypothetical protein